MKKLMEVSNLQIPEFSEEELAEAVRFRKNNKACDASGISAEVLKNGSELLLKHMLSFSIPLPRKMRFHRTTGE